MTKIDKSYIETLELIKKQVRSAQLRASLAVNIEMIKLYWFIGNTILAKQKQEGWGTSVINTLSTDLKKEFSTLNGFSPRNLRDMKMFASEYPKLFTSAKPSIWQQLVANLPWGHNIKLMSSIKNKDQRLWYAQEAVKNGWSRNVLIHQIESKLYQRQATNDKIHNFTNTLPSLQSDLAHNILKDEYNFEFLRGSQFTEKELEDNLTDNIVKFLLELGKGFAFVGRQYHLEVGGQDFYCDLLFYNLELRSYVVIELKTGEFKPEYAGKVGFYLSVLDEKLKHKNDNDSIGIILCTKNNKEISKHAVKYMTKPLGVSEYKIAEQIEDKKISKVVPSPKELLNKLKPN